MTEIVKIIRNTSSFELPKRETEGSSGMDVRANIENSITLSPLERVLIPTGISLELPKGIECQVRPRSGLALKHGITVLNSPGTIDEDYTGEIGIILINLSNKDFEISPGDRIAQFVFGKWEKVTLIEDNAPREKEETHRGNKGFGSTGIK